MKKINPKVAFIRADGSKSIGLGHLSRACLVAQVLEQLKYKAKVVLKQDEAGEYFLKTRGVKAVPIPSSASVLQEEELLRNMAHQEAPALFVLDILENDINRPYMQNINGLGCPVVAITDDSERRVIAADLVINANPHQDGQDYAKEQGKYLLGPKYFLMDPAYAKIRTKTPLAHPKKIFLTFGGSDHNDLLFRVLTVLERLKADLFVVLVVSRATGYINRLKKYLKQSTLPHELFVDVKSLVPFWSRCDLAITAGGNTLFERIATRTPGATVCQLERQMEIADRFQKLGVNFNLGFGPMISDDTLYNGIRQFIDHPQWHIAQYEKSPAVVDGQGLDRFKEEIKKLLEEKVYELRSA